MTKLTCSSVLAPVCLLVLASSVYAKPLIHVKEDAIRGIYTYGAEKPFEFVITNTGDEDLVIEKLVKSCGCASAEIDETTIAPGKSAKLKGTYQPNPLKETFSVSVMVKSNAGNEPLKRLSIAGRNFPPDLEINPMHVDLASLIGLPIKPVAVSIRAKGRIQFRKVQLLPDQAASGDPKWTAAVPPEAVGDPNGPYPNSVELVLNEETPAGPKWSGVVALADVNNADHRVAFSLLVDPNLGLGNYKGRIKVHVVIDKEPKEFIIPIAVQVLPEFKILPARIEITPLPAIRKYHYRVLVANRTSAPILSCSVESPEQSLLITSKKNDSGSWYLYLEVPNDPSLYGRTLNLRLNLEMPHRTENIDLPLIVHAG